MKRKYLPVQRHYKDKTGYLLYTVDSFDKNLKLLFGISFILMELIKATGDGPFPTICQSKQCNTAQYSLSSRNCTKFFYVHCTTIHNVYASYKKKLNKQNDLLKYCIVLMEPNFCNLMSYCDSC